MTTQELHAWRNLFSAVLILTCESGSVQERLADAYLSTLRKLSEYPDVPEIIRADLAELHARLTGGEAIEADGALRDSIHQLDREDARRMAGKIVSIYDKLAREAA